jgi:hypothetical protein
MAGADPSTRGRLRAEGQDRWRDGATRSVGRLRVRGRVGDDRLQLQTCATAAVSLRLMLLLSERRPNAIWFGPRCGVRGRFPGRVVHRPGRGRAVVDLRGGRGRADRGGDGRADQRLAHRALRQDFRRIDTSSARSSCWTRPRRCWGVRGEAVHSGPQPADPNRGRCAAGGQRGGGGQHRGGCDRAGRYGAAGVGAGEITSYSFWCARRATRLDRAGSASKTALRPRVLAHAGASARAGACPVRAGAGVRSRSARARGSLRPRGPVTIWWLQPGIWNGGRSPRDSGMSGSDSIERRPR